MSRNSAAVDDLSELKSQFLASLNYEVRTPLTGILGMLDLLLETELTEEQKECAELSRICAGNLLDIMNSTLEFSALAANQVTLEEVEFTIRELLDGLLDEYRVKAQSKGLSFRRDLAESIPEVVVGDAVRIRQMLGNLLENAIKFTPRGEVRVAASCIAIKGGGVLLTVAIRDTGIGIAPDKLDSIFDSFRQVETGLSRRFTGIGLGLAVTHKLAELMNAALRVASEFGSGSTFSVDIPMRLPALWGQALSRPPGFRPARQELLPLPREA